MSDIFISGGIVALLFFGSLVVITIIGAIIGSIMEWKSILPGIITAVIAIAVAFVSLFIYLCSIVNRTEMVNEEFHSEVILERDLYAVHTGQQLYGEGEYEQTLFFGEGSLVIASMDVYRYYYQEGDRIRQTSIPAEEAYIEYIDANSTPKLVKYYDYCVQTYHLKGTDKVKDCVTDETTYYVFYVPEGSVAQVYNFD